MIVLVCNPVAKRARAVLEVAGSVDDLVVLPTTARDSGPGQAQEALRMGAERVLVAGGDGTVRAVAHTLRGSGVPLGVVPIGTANIFARNLGLVPRRSARLLVELARTHVVRPVDVGLARWRVDEQWSDEQAFLVLAGIGHDAATVLGTTSAAKSRLGWPAYLRSGVRQVLSKPVAMHVSLDDAEPILLPLWSLLAGNTPRVPGGIEVFPGARLDDGQLSLTLCSVDRPHQWAAIGAKGLLRLAREVPRLDHASARLVRVTPTEPQPIQLDGDVFGPVHELEVRVAPASLSVLLPVRY